MYCHTEISEFIYVYIVFLSAAVEVFQTISFLNITLYTHDKSNKHINNSTKSTLLRNDSQAICLFVFLSKSKF